MEKLVIYVAGPYSAPRLGQIKRNVEAALRVGVEIMRRGHLVYIPHLTYWLDQTARRADIIVSYEQWMEIDQHWLGHCNALYFLAPSPGADRELEMAHARGMRVFQSLDEIPEVG